jgi:trimeric autotransporter adhesin
MRLFIIVATLASFATGSHSQSLTISTIAGGTRLGPALSANIGQPTAVVADTFGNLYFLAQAAIFKVDSSATLTRIAGTNASGFSGDDGPAIDAQLDGPTALAVDRAGNLYIAEGGGHIRKIAADGTITTIAGNGVCHGGCYTNGAGDGGPATSAELFYPWQIAVDAGGSVYIGEWNTPRVRKISTGGIISTVVGNGMSGFSGDGGPATNAKMGAAWGLAFDSAGSLFISDDIPGDDFNPDAVRIRKVTSDGIITTVAGIGAPGLSPDTGDGGPATNAQFAVSGSLAVDTAGNLYFSDYLRMRKVSPEGIITTFAGNGSLGYSGDGGPAVNAQINATFYGPALAADSAGNVYLADTGNHRIRKIAPDGTISTTAGDGGDCCFSGDGGPAINAQLFTPAGVAVGSDGTVFIADTFNNRIRQIDSSGVITTIAGTGQPWPESGDGGQGTSAAVNWPTGIKLDGSGNLYIAEAGNMRVRKLSRNGVITTVAGNGTSGYNGDSGAAIDAQLSWPKDIASDGQGNLYIADTANNVIRMVSSSGVITTIAGTGQSGFSGDGGAAIAATMNLPSGLAVDGAGNLFIADTNNFRVRKITAAGLITTVAGTGTKGRSGDNGPAIAAQLTGPTGLAFDQAGNLFIGDSASVRIVSPGGIITTVAGNGTVGFTGDGGPAASAEIGAWGLAFDSAGWLYIADPWNNAIRVVK